LNSETLEIKKNTFELEFASLEPAIEVTKRDILILVLLSVGILALLIMVPVGSSPSPSASFAANTSGLTTAASANTTTTATGKDSTEQPYTSIPVVVLQTMLFAILIFLFVLLVVNVCDLLKLMRRYSDILEGFAKV
jgi:hypothetical protein